jgi:hypothetical protein
MPKYVSEEEIKDLKKALARPGGHSIRKSGLGRRTFYRRLELLKLQGCVIGSYMREGVRYFTLQTKGLSDAN